MIHSKEKWRKATLVVQEGEEFKYWMILKMEKNIGKLKKKSKIEKDGGLVLEYLLEPEPAFKQNTLQLL